jgi:hypothetical protein
MRKGKKKKQAKASRKPHATRRIWKKEKKQKLYLNLIPKNTDQYKHYKSGN